MSVGGKSSRIAGVSMGAADFGALMLSANVGGQALIEGPNYCPTTIDIRGVV